MRKQLLDGFRSSSRSSSALGGRPKPGLTSADLYKLQSVGSVQLSPDGTHVAYSITHNERPGRPVQRHVDPRPRDRQSRQAEWRRRSALVARRPVGRLPGAPRRRRRPDRRRSERRRRTAGRADRAAPIIRCPRPATPSRGRPTAARSRSCRRRPGPKPTTPTAIRWSSRAISTSRPPAKGSTRFNDNKRLHVFVVDVGTRQVSPAHRPATFYEHSIDWSPTGDEIAVRLEPRSRPRQDLQLRHLRRRA